MDKMDSSTVGFTQSDHYSCLEDLEETYTTKSVNPLFLTYCGKEDCVPGWCFGPHIRDNYVIHVILDGKGVYKVRGREFLLTKGQMFVIYPGENTVYQADRQTPWSYCWVGYNGYHAETVTEEIGFTREDPVASLTDTLLVEQAIDRMLEARTLTIADDLHRMSALYDVFARIMEKSSRARTRRNSSDVRYVNMAMELIAASYNQKIRIADIADQVGINRSYLSNIFKRETGVSPQAFLINFRLERAAQMLRETEDTIGSIAAAVGYTDPLTFSKAFKQKFRRTPSEYRHSAPEVKQVWERGGYDGSCPL